MTHVALDLPPLDELPALDALPELPALEELPPLDAGLGGGRDKAIKPGYFSTVIWPNEEPSFELGPRADDDALPGTVDELPPLDDGALLVSHTPPKRARRAQMADGAAAYSEALSDNVHVNTPLRELEIIRRFAPIGLDPCSNPTAIVGATVDWWGPHRKCAICGAPATHGLSISAADRCDEHVMTDVEPAEALLRVRVPDSVLQDRRYGVDGLAMSPWGAYVLEDEIVFLQPPYGKAIVPWIAKANEERDAGAGIIGLLPGRFDTKWFRAMRPDRICWYGRRIPFSDSTKPGQKDSAKFPSVLPYWGPHTARFEEIFGEHGVVTPWVR